MNIATFIPASNGALHDYQVRYLDGRGTEHVHVVEQSKSMRNALASFGRAFPGGRIVGVRKVVGK